MRYKSFLRLYLFILTSFLSIASQAASVDISIANEWGSGFQGNVTIANDSQAVNGWVLTFDAEFDITQIWNAEILGKIGNSYRIGPVSWNANIATGGQVSFGFIGSGSVQQPTNIALNGQADSTPTPTPTPTPTATPTPTLVPTPTATPNPTSTPTPITRIDIPGILQAEDYHRFADTAVGNEGGEHRSDDVDIEATSDVNGGYNVGWTAAGEWLEFDVRVVSSADYEADIRVASVPGGGMLTIELDGQSIGSDLSIVATGGWQSWSTQKLNLGNMAAGNHRLRVQIQNGGFNLNWIDIKEASTGGSPTPTPTVTPTPTPAPSGDFVAQHGQLSISGGQLVDKNNQPIQLRGMSSHGLQWFGQYMNRDSIRWLRDDWGITVIRAAMYTDPDADGYIADNSLKNKVFEMVDAAIDLGIYVIVDWHILHDNDPNIYKTEAKAFFDEVSRMYANVPNIIYEIANEPNSNGPAGNVQWGSHIKPYANEVVPVIRNNDPDGIVIVGTANWSQLVDDAARDPLSFSNIMYTAHFYACTHGQWLRDRISNALAQGAAVFVTEWGTSEASGGGRVCTGESDVWLDFLNRNNISWANWSITDKEETSAALAPGASTFGGWSESNLSTSGRYVRRKIKE